jgi:hypothetical protein
MASADISGCKVCPVGFVEELRDGKPEYKDFRKMPHVACVKKKAVEKAPEIVAKPPESKEKSIITLIDFGFESGRVRYGVKSAQAYFFLENMETGKRSSFRHFNIDTILGKNEYGKLSDSTYEFQHGKEFKTAGEKKFRYPDKFRIETEIRGGKSDSGGYAWFETDPLSRNIYCQPHYKIAIDKRDDGSYTLHEATCIAGNIRQIGFDEAPRREMKVTGDFKEWLDIKDPDVKIDNKELIIDHVDRFNEKLDFKVA